VLSGLDGAYSSYTLTDISRAHFENAATRFAHEADKITFKTLDIRNSPVDQGYIANSYDVSQIISSQHAFLQGLSEANAN
jgi:hypothetical protein